MAPLMTSPWSVTITAGHWEQLYAHLFPGDVDEHAAVLRCGIAKSARGTRLLVRDVVIAADGIDYIPGDRGYRKLTPEFVLQVSDSCAEEGLAYLAVHCHGGVDSVRFSLTDLESHERGYPALLDITESDAVGALVFAERAVAGDIWTPSRERFPLDNLRVVGRPELRLYPQPRKPDSVVETYDRQARLFGDRGQEIIGSQRVAVVGLGGAGSLINEYLARLGVGELVLIDPDRIETTNISRVVGARRIDAWPWLTDPTRPDWMQRLGRRISTPKVRIAARVARKASYKVDVTSVFADVTEADVAAILTSCDHIFLAADSHSARRLVDSLTHQYLIPSTQVGAKVSVNEATGEVTDVFSVSRANSPGSGCLRCNELVSPQLLQEEGKSHGERRCQRYVDGEDIPAPSVITLNAVAAARAVDDWMLSLTGLVEEGVGTDHWVMYHPLYDGVDEFEPAKNTECPSCGPSRFALGDAVRLPTRMR